MSYNAHAVLFASLCFHTRLKETSQRELLQTGFQRLARNLELCRERLTVLDRPDVGRILETLRPLEWLGLHIDTAWITKGINMNQQSTERT